METTFDVTLAVDSIEIRIARTLDTDGLGLISELNEEVARSFQRTNFWFGKGEWERRPCDLSLGSRNAYPIVVTLFLGKGAGDVIAIQRITVDIKLAATKGVDRADCTGSCKREIVLNLTEQRGGGYRTALLARDKGESSLVRFILLKGWLVALASAPDVLASAADVICNLVIAIRDIPSKIDAHQIARDI